MKKNNTGRLKNLLILIFGNIILMLLLSILSRNFLTYGNLSSVMLRMSVYAMLGIATTIVFISGGFDLTIGAVMSLSGALAGTLYAAGIPFYLVIIIALISGALVGIINGYFVVNLNLSPFIVTLATMSIVQSIVYGILKGNVITTLPDGFLNLGYVYLLKLPLLFVFMIVIAVLSSLMMTRSVLGRKIFAVGGNEKTAFISGINVRRIKYCVYILSGILSATAGLMFTVRIRAVIPDAGLNAPLEVITAVLIGGTTIYGGKGSIPGSILGVLTMYLLLNGFSPSRVKSFLGSNNIWNTINSYCWSGQDYETAQEFAETGKRIGEYYEKNKIRNDRFRRNRRE